MPAEENIALIHRGLDAFSRGDFDAGVEDMQPDVEWHVSFRLPDLPLDKAVYHGHDEVRRLWAAFRSGWATLTVTLEDVVDAREDVVVVRTRFVGQGSASGIEVDRTVFYVFEIVAGKLEATAAVRYRGRSPRSRRAVGVGDVAGEPENRSRDLRSVRNQRSGLQGLQPLGRGRRRHSARRLARER